MPKRIQKRTSSKPGKSKPSKPSSHVAYDLLLRAIESGRLQPGSRLREVELADRFGISRTPVREAIKRLESHGLVTHEPNQGAVITKLDYARTVELYLVREVLEGAGARLAATLATQAELGVLRAMMDEHRGFQNNPAELVYRDRLFHKQIQLTARNHFLNDILDNLRISQILMPGTTLAVQARPAALLDEHEAIVDAIVARDPDKAEAAARLHVRNAFAARLKLYADQQRAAL
jgi:DNA-binding GntR family transcriptional regulator